MKKLLKIVCLLQIVVNVHAQQGWFMLDTGLTSNEHGGLSVIDENTVYIIGDGGKFLKTIDGGENWIISDLGISEDFYDLSFYNSNFGIAVGSNGTLIKTNDGGDNWTLIELGINIDLRSIELLDLNNIWVAGSGVLLSSNDAGANWIVEDFQSGPFDQVAFKNENEGYITGLGNIILRTTDGGTTWGSNWYGVIGYFSSMTFTDNYYFVMGDTFQLLKSMDGVNFGYISSLIYPSLDLEFQNDNIGFSISSDCTTNGDCYIVIMKTIDSGQTWNLSYNDWDPPKIIGNLIADIKFVSENVGFALSGSNILKTIDGGTYIGVNDLIQEPMIEVFPNPLKKQVTIISENEIIKKIELFNYTAQSLCKIENVDSNEVKINIDNYPKGIYFVIIELDNGKCLNKRIIKI